MSKFRILKTSVVLLIISTISLQAEAATASYSITRGQGSDGNNYTIHVFGDLIHSLHVQLANVDGWKVFDAGTHPIDPPEWIASISSPLASEHSLNWFSAENVNTTPPRDGFQFQSPDALINFIPQMQVFVDYAETEDTWVPIEQTVVPVPGALLLFGSGISSLLVIRKRKQQKG